VEVNSIGGRNRVCQEKNVNLSHVTEKQLKEEKICVGHYYAPTNTKNNIKKT
jgi:hypothetical protein